MQPAPIKDQSGKPYLKRTFKSTVNNKRTVIPALAPATTFVLLLAVIGGLSFTSNVSLVPNNQLPANRQYTFLLLRSIRV